MSDSTPETDHAISQAIMKYHKDIVMPLYDLVKATSDAVSAQQEIIEKLLKALGNK
jgi:hypothetical protein